MANESNLNQDAERELAQADVQLEQQGASPAERERLAYGALGEEGGDAVKEKYIDSWRNDNQNSQNTQNTQNTQSQGGNSR